MGLTSDPNDPRLGRRGPEGNEGQNDTYLILSDEERAKGFVRPVRLTYIHIGREVCGLAEPTLYDKAVENNFLTYVCVNKPGHEGDHDHWAPIRTDAQLERLQKTGFLDGCGRPTTMNRAIAETYARDPSFYGATFCAHCNTHRPVGEWGEFVWADVYGHATTERVGT